MTTPRRASTRRDPFPARAALLAAVLLLAALAAAPALAQHRAPAPDPDPQAALAGLDDALAWVENRGQWDGDVLFQARLGGADVWVTPDALVFDFYEVDAAERDAGAPGALPHERPEASRRGHVVAMRFEGGHARRAVGSTLLDGYHNYFLGDDPAKWASHVPRYAEVVLEGLYDGVDLRLYDDGGALRYDLVLAPGADPSAIRVRMEGAEGVSVAGSGALRVATAVGPVEHRGLLAYQPGAAGSRDVVESAFEVSADGAVSFDVRGADPARALVIDPLIWSTFLGGTNTDIAYGVAVGPDGAATVAGYTQGAGFPTTAGAYDTGHNGGNDAFVARLSPDGSALAYSTFLGSTSSDGAQGVAVGADGAATVAGYTQGAGFPTTPGAYDTSYNGGADAFVARLSPDGSALAYATFLGGTSLDIAYGVAVGPDGAATLAGETASSGFPTTAGAYDTSHNGGRDAFVARLAIPLATLPACGPDSPALLLTDFATGDGAEFFDLTNTGLLPLDLTDCVALTYDVFTGNAALTFDLDGIVLTPSEAYRIGNAGVPGVDREAPVGFLPEPWGFGFVKGDLAPGETAFDLRNRIVTSVIYLGEDAVYLFYHSDLALDAAYCGFYAGRIAPSSPEVCPPSVAARRGGGAAAFLAAARALQAALGQPADEAATASSLPSEFALAAAYPNPTTGTATLGYDLPEASPVRLAVYDALGRTVAVLVDGEVEAGRHAASLAAGSLAPGVYLVRLTAGPFTATRRVTVVR